MATEPPDFARTDSDSMPDRRDSAVALTYTHGESAPRVVAKGRGLIAQEIIARAREAGVFVHESPELVSLLMQVDLDERIPPTLYVAVAELLAWLYKVEQRQGSPIANVLSEQRNNENADTGKKSGNML